MTLLQLALVGHLIAASVAPPPPLPARPVYQGYAAYYHPGIMAAVATNRGMPQADCMVASPYHPLGAWVTVTRVETGDSLWCQVTDEPAPEDRAAIIARGIIIELDFSSAQLLCGVREYGDTAPWECEVRVW